MTKIIDFKKSIVKKGKKEKATDDEFYAEINQTSQIDRSHDLSSDL